MIDYGITEILTPTLAGMAVLAKGAYTCEAKEDTKV